MEVQFKEMDVSNLKQLRSSAPVRMLLATVLAGALVSAAVSAAAEPATDETSTKTEPSTADKSSNDDQKKDGSKDDDFIPTEEISEDFAVSFPVDI